MKENCRNEISFSGSADLFAIMKMFLKREHNVTGAQEHLWIVSLSSTGKLSNIELVSMGNRSLADIKTSNIFQVAIQKGAESIVVIQNRKDYSIDPSHKDQDFAGRMIQAGEIIELKITDYMIISPAKYYSFRDSGLMEILGKEARYIPQEDEKSRLKKESEAISLEIEIQNERDKGKLDRSLDIARQMLDAGESIDKIVLYTGLSRVQIDNIR